MKLTILKNQFFRKNIFIALSILLVICLIEFVFDVVEITMGEILEISNPFRSKSGTVWEINKQDQIAEEHLLEITQNISAKDKSPEINTIFELKSLLDEQGTVVISADQFLKIYNMIPPQSAQEIIAPFDLLKISYGDKWFWTKITKRETSLQFFFLDGDNQLLIDSYPDIAVFYHVAITEIQEPRTLESMANFSGRTFSADQFLNAFNNLPNPIKLQLINNPFKLIKWYKNIGSVAISRYVNNYTILLGFEVFDGVNTQVHTFEASQLATNYLIAQLNSLYPELKLKMPGSFKDELNFPS